MKSIAAFAFLIVLVFVPLGNNLWPADATVPMKTYISFTEGERSAFVLGASDALIYMGLFCAVPVAPSVGDIQRRLESLYKGGKIKDNDKAVAGIFAAAFSFGCEYTAIFPKLLEKDYGKGGISK